MEGTSLLALPEGIVVEQIQITENGLLIEIVATSPTSCCPSCSQPSSSIHCHYRRTLRDVACAGRRVQLFLTVRKFSCCMIKTENTSVCIPPFCGKWDVGPII